MVYGASLKPEMLKFSKDGAADDVGDDGDDDEIEKEGEREFLLVQMGTFFSCRKQHLCQAFKNG